MFYQIYLVDISVQIMCDRDLQCLQMIKVVFTISSLLVDIFKTVLFKHLDWHNLNFTA